jgi:hypothetical protein
MEAHQAGAQHALKQLDRHVLSQARQHVDGREGNVQKKANAMR